MVDRAKMVEFDCPSYDGNVEAAEGIPAGAQELHGRFPEPDFTDVLGAPE